MFSDSIRSKFVVADAGADAEGDVDAAQDGVGVRLAVEESLAFVIALIK
jgi:hypothetical protein